jgi:hypothetical protein
MTKIQAVMEFDAVAWREAAGGVDIYATSSPLACAVAGPGQLAVKGLGSARGIMVGQDLVLRHQVYSLNGFSFTNATAPKLSEIVIWSIPGIYDSTFSRTVWSLYGGAKGLVIRYGFLLRHLHRYHPRELRRPVATRAADVDHGRREPFQ